MTQTLTSYTSIAARLSREEFVEAHPDAVLVIPPLDDYSDNLVLTQRIPVRGDDRTPVGGAGGFVIGPIKKRPGANPFGSFVTIGRASNNDIVTLRNEVSKVHAYFVRGPDGSYMVRDGHSTNGTFVNAKPVSSDQPMRLHSKDTVSLGACVSAVFLEAADFYDFLLT